MEKLSRFWRTLEETPGQALALVEWKARLGPELDLVRSWLRPTQRLAASYRCPDPDRYCIHKVVQHGPNDYVGVCPDGCPTVSMPKTEIIVYELDRVALGRMVAEVLGLQCAVAPVPGVRCTLRLGTYVPYAGLRFPAYLAFPSETEEFGQIVDALLAGADGPFILLAPTRSVCSATRENQLKIKTACFLPLDELLSPDDGSRVTLADGQTADQVLAAFREAVLPKAADESGMLFFPTPAEAHWKDVRIRFRDSHTISVRVKDTTGVYHYTQMGMADGRNSNPTKQWDLLELFARNHGVLDWDNSDASRERQKQRENLAKNLAAFFRLDGDPFMSEGNGWKTLFSVEMQ